MSIPSDNCTTPIPTRLVGPLLFNGEGLQQVMLQVPLATFETTLWPSTTRGAKISQLCGGINSYVTSDSMTRSVIVEADNSQQAMQTKDALQAQQPEIAAVIAGSSRFAKLQQLHIEQVANLLYIRFSCSTGDAAGHNMTTQAADAALNWIMAQHPGLKYVSISGNYCTDKKNSAINGICGRGKRVIAEINIPTHICQKHLRIEPGELVNLHIKKNLIGSILAGSVRSANAHFSNILLATYLATGQDAANIVEGSQGITHAEVRPAGLHFSVTLPNLIVGCVGNGKQHPHIQRNLELLHCNPQQLSPQQASRRLAAIIGATVLCSELSLLAAMTNKGELMRAHRLYERRQTHKV